MAIIPQCSWTSSPHGIRRGSMGQRPSSTFHAPRRPPLLPTSSGTLLACRATAWNQHDGPGVLAQIGRTVVQLAAAAAILISPLSAAAHGDMQQGTVLQSSSSNSSSSSTLAAGHTAHVCVPLSDDERVDAYGDLNGYNHSILTSSPAAQRLFNQGLLHAYNFNQPEALVAFRTALRYDPKAPMLHWGIAYASGPFLNKVAAPPPADGTYPVFTEKELQQGRDALRQASQLLEAQQPAADAADDDHAKLWQRESLYVKALSKLYDISVPYGPEFESAEYDYAYAMMAILDDADALALASEALGNLQPWEFWEPGTQEPRARTSAALLMSQLSLMGNRSHPLAAHLLIHMVEALNPGRGYHSAGLAERAADMLSTSYPTFGHLTHMASHTYLRVGRWHDAVDVNVRAAAADRHDSERCIEPYMPAHNVGMLIYAASMGAERGVAEQWAAEMGRMGPEYGPMYMTDGRDRAMSTVVWTHFGQWDKVLGVSAPQLDPSKDGIMMPPTAPLANKMIYHYARTLALAAKAQRAAVDGAPDAAAARQRVDEEVAAFQAAVAALPPDPMTLPGTGIGIYSPGFKTWSAEAAQVVQARLAVLDGDLTTAAAHLNEAVLQEPLSGYTEPPRFYQPARQCLGWVLLQAGDPAGAAAVYEKDLTEYPENPWSLAGLRDALRAELKLAGEPDVASAAKTAAAEQQGAFATRAYLRDVETRLAAASQHVDPAVPLNSSCPAFSTF